MSDVVRIGDATLYHGDAILIVPTLGLFDSVITDPPYGIGIARAVNRGKGCKAKSTFYDDSDWDDYKPTDSFIREIVGKAKFSCIWGGNYFSLGPQRTWLVWDKMLRGQDMADCELAWTNYTGKGVRLIRHLWSGFFRDGDDPRGVHPAQKPENVMRWCVLQSPKAGTVLDPFMGSGTTGVACAQLGRKFTGIEIERKYFDIACERIELAYAQGQLIPHEPAQQPEQQSMGL